ncbi:isocitrate lyase/PEP mutase family protein [Nonomuraea fuscirosea]|uniref:isocitrate lyase/PEP mutase family protein n=1 Tax=Nonomuraea fuscirosea TaxID=1291556 RepID=UPI0034392621
MTDQAAAALRFRELHERPEPLLLPNPWDPGTARLLASLGFEALATTSLGVANQLGRRRASRQAILGNLRAISDATPLPVNAVLTARAENLLWQAGDLDDTISRLRAFEEAGADVLYAPGLRTLDEMRAVASSVGGPVNVVMGFADPEITLAQLAEIGVRRVSIGGALSRVALRSFMDAAKEMRAGHFGFVTRMAPLTDFHPLFT